MSISLNRRNSNEAFGTLLEHAPFRTTVTLIQKYGNAGQSGTLGFYHNLVWRQNVIQFNEQVPCWCLSMSSDGTVYAAILHRQRPNPNNKHYASGKPSIYGKRVHRWHSIGLHYLLGKDGVKQGPAPLSWLTVLLHYNAQRYLADK